MTQPTKQRVMQRLSDELAELVSRQPNLSHQEVLHGLALLVELHVIAGTSQRQEEPRGLLLLPNRRT